MNEVQFLDKLQLIPDAIHDDNLYLLTEGKVVYIVLDQITQLILFETTVLQIEPTENDIFYYFDVKGSKIKSSISKFNVNSNVINLKSGLPQTRIFTTLEGANAYILDISYFIDLTYQEASLNFLNGPKK